MILMHFPYLRLLPTALLALACGSLHGQTLDTLARDTVAPETRWLDLNYNVQAPQSLQSHEYIHLMTIGARVAVSF